MENKCEQARQKYYDALEKLKVMFESFKGGLESNIKQQLLKESEKLSQELQELFNQIKFPEKIKESLTAEYKKCIEDMKWYELIKEDKERGEFYYEADYDGTNEEDENGNQVKGKNFEGHKYKMPKLKDILNKLTVKQIKLIQEMEANGLKPKLQLTPIGYNIKTIAGKLDAKKDEIGGLFTYETYVWKEKLDQELIYEAKSFKASNDGKKKYVKEGLTKSQYIKKYKGWVIDIVATKQEMEEEKPGTNAQKTEAFMQEAIQKGYRGLSYESYLLAQMQALKVDPQKPLDTVNFTILPESSLTDSRLIARAYWDFGQVSLRGYCSDYDNLCLRLRGSVRVF